jgi:parallel beta-helix repeat protein
MILLLAILAQAQVVAVDRDNLVIRESCRVVVPATAIIDADNDGVIQISADGVTIDFAGATLSGAGRNATPDTFKGFGVRITGRNVTLKNAKVSGFEGGIYATGADGLTLENCDVSDNFAQRLKSTPAAEDGGDWLWPHKNDGNEWLTNYGAGICVEDSKNVTVRNCRARRTQNGLIFDRVVESKAYDNDFSFLSGWGLAMWRCERDVISRNALDFCVRGYSHGVYNRGQDSAGILFFEQNIDNVIVGNSCTHGGDGFFAFAGREALGEDWTDTERERLKKETGKENVDDLIKVPPEMREAYIKRGNRGNIIVDNDLSYAAAHGLELTFSFDNWIVSNRIVENAICGIWAGYSQGTIIHKNTIERNGTAGYGLERGGVNIEHGQLNFIWENQFQGNTVGVHLWWDPDPGLLLTPWALANGAASENNTIVENQFDGDETAIHLRACGKTIAIANRFKNVKKEFEIDGQDVTHAVCGCGGPVPRYAEFGQIHPVGARRELRGRDRIIMTEWGPYDWQAPYLQFLGTVDGGHVYRLLGREALKSATVTGDGVRAETDAAKAPPEIRVVCDRGACAAPYSLGVRTDSQTIERRGTLIAADWNVTVFASPNDPRENPETWRKAAEAGITFTARSLSLRYGNGGPSDLKDAPQNVKDAKLPRDRFGTLASTELSIPAGDWRISTESDDGIRVWVDEKLVIDDWTHHVPTKHSAELKIETERRVRIRVEHFELDGFAVLTVDLEPRTIP